MHGPLESTASDTLLIGQSSSLPDLSSFEVYCTVCTAPKTGELLLASPVSTERSSLVHLAGIVVGSAGGHSNHEQKRSRRRSGNGLNKFRIKPQKTAICLGLQTINCTSNHGGEDETHKHKHSSQARDRPRHLPSNSNSQSSKTGGTTLNGESFPNGHGFAAVDGGKRDKICEMEGSRTCMMHAARTTACRSAGFVWERRKIDIHQTEHWINPTFSSGSGWQDTVVAM